MKQQDHNSKRFQRRQNRNFAGSRPNRRAQRRLAIAMAIYEKGISLSKNNPRAYRKPGALSKW